MFFCNDLVHIMFGKLTVSAGLRSPSSDQFLSKGIFEAFSVGIKGRKTAIKTPETAIAFQYPYLRKYMYV